MDIERTFTVALILLDVCGQGGARGLHLLHRVPRAHDVPPIPLVLARPKDACLIDCGEGTEKFWPHYDGLCIR